MSLIELLFTYRDLIRELGQESADKFLKNVCDPKLAKHIKASLTDKGKFIGADQEIIVASWRYQNRK